MRTMLYGAEADKLRDEVSQYPALVLVEQDPEVIVCYGGDGTLLAAERTWPGIPKVPIKNSRRGLRCLPHPPHDVLERLAGGELIRTEYMKLECSVSSKRHGESTLGLAAMNEINVHMGHINSAVRFRLWIDDEPYHGGQEIIGDGFVISTPFGSTAYFTHITRGVFHVGIGVAFKAPTEQTTHVIAHETSTIRVLITRGPAVLALDNAPEYIDLGEGDRIEVTKHAHPAVLLTWQPMAYPSDEF